MNLLVAAVLVFLSSCHALFVPEDSANGGTVQLPQTGNKVIDDPNRPFPSEDYPYHVVLDDNYELFWNFNDTHITFETIVKTNGYIGFGISPNGAMLGSDIVIGWVKNGLPHFADRHGIGHIMPVLDTSQDWTLLLASESGDYTTMTMTRKLDTCDNEDFPIKEGTTRIIYSYNDQDPGTDDSIPYHRTNRGTKSLLLLDPPTVDQNTTALLDNVRTLDFLNSNYSVPGTRDTTYHCTIWKLPDLGGKHHMVRYEPVIQPGHEQLVHHILLYYCSKPVDSFVGQSFICYEEHPPELDDACYHVFIAWAIGGEAFNYPEHVGHSLGTAEDPGYFMMETHYDNPHMRSDFVDNSGIRMFLTTDLRQHDAGLLEAGVAVSPYLIIPPYEPNFVSSGYCSQGCMEDVLQTQDIFVFANGLHSHLLGRKLRTRLFRNGTELPIIAEDNNYDFNYQEMRMLVQERTLTKDDSIIVECDYDSTGRTSPTFGGLSTRHEMCLSFLLYYPRVPFTQCLSTPKYNIPPQFDGLSIFQIAQILDWTDPHVRDLFAEDFASSSYYQVCRGQTQDYAVNFQLTPSPNVTKASQTASTCPSTK